MDVVLQIMAIQVQHIYLSYANIINNVRARDSLKAVNFFFYLLCIHSLKVIEIFEGSENNKEKMPVSQQSQGVFYGLMYCTYTDVLYLYSINY